VQREQLRVIGGGPAAHRDGDLAVRTHRRPDQAPARRPRTGRRRLRWVDGPYVV